MRCIQVLLPALITTKEQEEMTKRAQKSIVSFDHCVKVTVDTEKYDSAVAGVWNNFLDQWRGKDYDYLIITANDVEFDPLAIDYNARFLEENPDVGISTFKVERDYDLFLEGFGQQEYTDKRTTDRRIDPAAFIIRKGVIEKVGRIDEEFPREFVERDYIHRVELAGFVVTQPDIVLNYHPPYAGTIGNDPERLQRALRKYVLKWGGDKEVYTHPYNDLSLDYTYCRK